MKTYIRLTLLAALACVSLATQAQNYESVPYSTGFEGLSTGQLPSGWTAIQQGSNSGVTFPCAYSYSGNTHTGSVYFEFESSASSSDTEIVALPYMLDINTLKLTMWVSTSSSYPCSLEVGVLEDDSSFTTVENLNLITFSGSSAWASNYHEYTVYFANYTGYGERMAMRAIRTGSGQFTLFVDDLSIAEDNGCYPLSDLSLTSADSSSITIGWVDTLNSNITYTVQYWAANGDTTTEYGISTTSYTAEDLTASTSYFFLVTPNCADGDGTPASGSFRTTCGVATLPFFEGFEDAGSIDCWTMRYQNSGTGHNTSGAQTGSGCFRFWYTSNPPIYLISPELVGTDDGVNVEFGYKRHSSYYSESFQVGYSTTTTDDSAFTWLTEVTVSTSGYQTYEATLPAGTKYFAISYTANNTYGIYIDDINLTPNNGCFHPNNIAVSNITSDGATINWTAGADESEWAISIGDDTYTSYDTFYTVSNLNAHTTYTVSVASVCNGDTTNWISTQFRTGCEDATCNVTLELSDSYYGYPWSYGGCSFHIFQYGDEIAAFSTAGSHVASVCAGDSVEVTFTYSSSYYSDDVNYSVLDGGNATIATGTCSGVSSGDVVATIADPCPNCIMPMQLSLDTASLTPSSATIYWEAGSASSWIVLHDNTYDNVTDTSYTFSNLNALTSYTVYVASNCSGDTSVYNSITFVTPCADSTCNMTVEMTDSYGDGWNGNSINFYQAGTQIGSATLNNGASGTENVSVCSSAPVVLVFNKGSYADEMGGTVTDGAGLTIFTISGMNNRSTGDTLANVEAPCPSCMPVSGLVVTYADSTSITYSWNVVAGNTYLVSFDDSAFVENNNGSYTATDLLPNTYYNFSIKTVCDIDDTSSVVTLSFRTTCSMMTLPYTENFELYNTGEMPSCWYSIHDYTFSGYYGTSTYPSVTGDGLNNSHALALSANGACMAATSAIPNNGLQGDLYHISFHAKLSSNYCSASAGVMTDIQFDTTYTSLVTIANDDTWHRYDIYTTGLNPSDIYHFAVRYDGTSSYSGYTLYIDSLLIELDAGCHYPTNLNVSAGSNSITVNWDNDGTAANYVVCYRPGNSGAYSYTYTGSTDSVVLNNVQPATSYQIRVGNICSNGDTLWVETSTVTDCGILSLTYFENFDSYSEDVMPPCWNYNSSAVTHFDGGLFFRSNTGPSYAAVLPQFGQPVFKCEIEFKTKVGPVSQGDAILVGVADASGSLLQWLDTLTDPNQSRSAFVWMNYRFNTYTGAGVRIALGRLYTGSDWALIDDITVREIPDCTPADTIAGHNLFDPDSSYFTWGNIDGNSNYEIYVDTVTADTTTIPTSMLTTVNGFSYLIPAGTLSGGGKYKFFIRSVCGPDLRSPWKSVVFGSGEFIMSQSGTDTVTSCGLVVYDNGGPIAGYYSQTSSSLVLYPDDNMSRLQIYGGYLSLYNDGNSTLTIYDGDSDNGTILYQTSYSGPTTMYDSIVTLPIATSTTGPLTISFSAGTYVNPGYELYVRCIPIVSCDQPNYIQSSNVTANSADLAWYGNADNYRVYYRPFGNSTWTTTTTSAANISLSGLTNATTYEVQIRALCSATDSSAMSSIYTFTTECDVVTINLAHSLVEDFEGVQIPPSCWQLYYGTGSNASINPVIYSADAAHSGNQGLRFSSENTVPTGNYSQTLVTPELDCDSNMAILFYVRASQNTETFRIGYSSTTNDLSAFTWHSPLSATSSWTHFSDTVPSSARFIAINYMASAPRHHLYIDSLVVTIDNGSIDCATPTITNVTSTFSTITVNYTALNSVEAGIVEGSIWDDATTAQPIATGSSYTFSQLFSDGTPLQDTTTYTIGLRSICGSSYSDWVTYTISTRAIVCNTPTNVSASINNATSATISWNGNGATLWEVQYGIGSDQNTVTANTASATLNSLTSGATYTAKVRAVCGSTFSDWSETVTFVPSSCPVPVGLSTSQIGVHTATFNWTDNGASQWEVAYGNAGNFSIDYATKTVVNTNSYTAGNLTANSNYVWLVRSICDNGDTSGWSSSIHFTTLSVNPEGIDEASYNNVAIYPNPTNDATNITLSGINGNVTIAIVDINGRTVLTETVSCNGECSKTIGVTSLPKGAYLVRVAGDNGIIAIKKLIVK